MFVSVGFRCGLLAASLSHDEEAVRITSFGDKTHSESPFPWKKSLFSVKCHRLCKTIV